MSGHRSTPSPQTTHGGWKAMDALSDMPVQIVGDDLYVYQIR
ncbi:hypothetical protein QP157_21085 [Sphingomonas sp. LR61]